MATLDQLEKALRNADAAGDTAAAQQLAGAIREMQGAALPAPPSTTEDVAKSGASGLARGAIDLVGLPGTIGDALKGGLQFGLRKGYEAVAGEAPDPKGGAVERFFATDPEMEAKMLGGGQNPLGGANLREAASDVTGGATEYDPKTTAGEFASTIGEFIPGAAAFGGVNPANLLRFGVLPGAASEGAGQLTEGSAIEPYARIAAALLSPAVPSMLRRAVTPFPASPQRQEMVDALAREGVDVTAGQRTGSQRLRYAESELGGRSAANMAERQGEQFTSAALRRAGITADRATPEVVDEAFTRIGGQFDNLAANSRVPFDQQLQDDMLNAVVDYQSVAASVAPATERVMNRAAELAAQNGGVLEGQAYQNLRSEIGKLSSKADGPTREALREIQHALDDAVERNMPQQFGEAWREARNQYRNMLVLEKAATGAGENAAQGIISPSQLRNATVGQNRRAYARGQGDFAELSRAGEAVLKPLPNSGTAPRIKAQNLGAGVLSMLGAGGGATVGGPMGAAAGAAAGAAIPRVAGAMMMSRPGQAFLGNQMLEAQPLLDERMAGVLAALLAQRGGVPAQQ